MSTDGTADVYQKIGVPYSLSTDTYGPTRIGGQQGPTIETDSLDNFPIGNGAPSSFLPGVNLLQKTQQFDDVYWVKARATVVANAVVAPNGSLTAEKLVEDTTASNTHTINSPNVAGGLPDTNYVFSVYAKAAERSRIRLRCGTDVAFMGDMVVDLLTGELVIAGPTSGVINVGNGWYRIWTRRLTQPLTTLLTWQVWLIDTGQNTNYTGNGTSGVYLWGAQLERADILGAYTAVA